MNLRSLARILIPAALLGAFASPAPAQETCTPFATQQLSRLTVRELAGQIDSLAALNPDQIKEVQQCLKSRGCYDGNPAAVDGIVKVFTRGALSRSAARQCVASPPPSDSCSRGEDMVSWKLTQNDVTKLEMPPPPPPPSADDSGQPEDAGPAPSKPSDELKAGLSLIQDADYFSRDLFQNDLTYFTLEPIPDPQKKKAAEQELRDRMPGILDNACKSHLFTDPTSLWETDLSVNEIQALSDRVYGFFPFWGFGGAMEGESTSGAARKAQKSDTIQRHKVDLGVLARIGWFGATFTGDGQLDLRPLNAHEKAHAVLVSEIAMARRFRTDVDLVVYKKLTAEQWINLMSRDPDTFVSNLSESLADEVGNPSRGLLDSVQCWAIPAALTSSPTEWDGATIYLDQFPWGDPTAMDFLKKLLRRIRLALYSREESPAICSRARRQLNLNLVVPYEAFVPNGDQPAINPTISALAGLIPNRRSDIDVGVRRSPEIDLVDNFLIFLPESTSVNKKKLRLVVEAAFNRNESTLRVLRDNPDVDLAVWRLQMLRRIIYVLSPAMVKYRGDYSRPGLQLLDDMVYAKNNFAAVGFMPLPIHDGNNAELAADIRGVFQKEQRDWVERHVSPIVASALGMHVVNIVGSRRREIFLLIEFIGAVLFFYFVVSRWIFELRGFFLDHKMPFVLAFLLAATAGALLCLFDRNLKQLGSYLLASLILLAAAVLGLWKYRQNKVEADLP